MGVLESLAGFVLQWLADGWNKHQFQVATIKQFWVAFLEQ